MAAPRDPDTQVDLSFLLNQAAYALEARLGGALADLGLSVREYCVLMKAGEAERTQAQVAELAGLDKTHHGRHPGPAPGCRPRRAPGLRPRPASAGDRA